MKADNPRKYWLGKEDWEGRKPKSVFKPGHRVNNWSVSTLGPLGECAEKTCLRNVHPVGKDPSAASE